MTLHVCIPLYDRRSECGLHISLARPPTEDRGCVAGRRAHNVLVTGVRTLCVINSERRTTVLEIYWRIVVGDVTATGRVSENKSRSATASLSVYPSTPEAVPYAIAFKAFLPPSIPPYKVRNTAHENKSSN